MLQRPRGLVPAHPRTVAPRHRECRRTRSKCSLTREQLRGTRAKKDGQAVLISWFEQNPPRMSYRCQVSATGTVASHRDVYDWAQQGSVAKSLSPLERRKLASRLAKLPTVRYASDVTRVLLVSFAKRGVWTTYCYDRKNLPSGVTDLLGILGLESAAPAASLRSSARCGARSRPIRETRHPHPTARRDPHTRSRPVTLNERETGRG